MTTEASRHAADTVQFNRDLPRRLVARIKRVHPRYRKWKEQLRMTPTAFVVVVLARGLDAVEEEMKSG